jgi:hypothetical protein
MILGKPDVIRDAIFNACRHLMRPIVRFLLRHKVTHAEFAELAKDVYVDVARREYGIQGRPTNNSRVAMMTGLSRREVARVRDRLLEDSEDLYGRRGNRISRVLAGWHSDEDFIDADGNPLALPATGSTGSLSELFRRYAGDLPYGALVKEMLGEGLIAAHGESYRVLKRDYTYKALDPGIVEQMSVSLHDHAATLDHNLDEERKSPPRFEGLADNANIPARSARAFMKLVENRGMDFLTEMDGWLSDHEKDADDDAGGRLVRVGVGVYLISDDI